MNEQDCHQAPDHAGGSEVDHASSADVDEHADGLGELLKILEDPDESIGLFGLIGEQVKEQLVPLNDHLKTIQDAMARIEEGIVRIGADEEVRSDMHRRYSQLAEKFHEREVLTPMASALVAVADRARHKCYRIRRRLSRGQGANKAARLALGQLLEAREADRIEIENTLSVFGVESYEHHEGQFDASLQKCMERLTCDDPQKHMKIARRLLPGYRREDRVIRPEIVSVYCCSESS